MNFEEARIHFLGNVFAAVAVAVVVGARFEGEGRSRVLFSRAIAHLAPHISYGTGARFSKVPTINGPGKLSPFTLKIEVSIVLHPTR